MILLVCMYSFIQFHHQDAQLNFRGQRIWLAAMEDLLSKGMKNAQEVRSCLMINIILFGLH